MTNDQQNEPNHLRTMRLFSGSRGERIEERWLCNADGSAMTEEERASRNIDEPLVVYFGVVSIVNTIPIPYHPMQEARLPSDVRIPINASSPIEALQNFQDAVSDFEQKVQQHQREMMAEMEKRMGQNRIQQATPQEVEAVGKEGLKLIRP